MAEATVKKVPVLSIIFTLNFKERVFKAANGYYFEVLIKDEFQNFDNKLNLLPNSPM